jgi:hypothetical protein
MSIQENNYYLMQVLNFTPQELMINRSGALSEGQRERLQARMGQYKQSGTRVIAVVMLMTAVAFAAVFFLSDAGESLRELLSTNPAYLVIPGVALLFWAIMVIAALANSGKINFDKARLMVITGKAKPKKVRTYYGPAAVAMAAAGPNALNCTVKIGRVQFYTDEETYKGFAKGLNYRVYYLPNGRMPLLVSAEALEG